MDMVEVTLTKNNHTEWVQEEQEDGEVKRVSKIFNRGDRVTVPKRTYEAFKDRMKIVEPDRAPAPPPSLVDRVTSLVEELASLTEAEKLALFAETEELTSLTEAEKLALFAETGIVEPVAAPLPLEGDENPKAVEPVSAPPIKDPAKKVGSKSPAKKVGSKK